MPNDSRIRDIVNGSAPVTHDEQEISGYKDALNLIHSEYGNLDINEETICLFHRMIEQSTNSDTAGIYKKNDIITSSSSISFLHTSSYAELNGDSNSMICKSIGDCSLYTC